ncbi:hypothetical protein [Microcoleus sp. herbarium12]
MLNRPALRVTPDCLIWRKIVRWLRRNLKAIFGDILMYRSRISPYR